MMNTTPKPRPITVDLNELPAAISDSVRAVLHAHGYVVCVRVGDAYEPIGSLRAVELIDEIGRNTAQAVVACEVES